MRKRRGSLVAGFLLVLIGGGLLINTYYPTFLDQIVPASFTWPWWVIGTGLLFLFMALLTGTGGLAIPGSIICTIGAILYYQNQTGDWESWAFIWALIPASVGLGMIIMAFIDADTEPLRGGLWLITINLVIFLIFWFAFRRDSVFLAQYWPVLLIAAGVVILIQAFLPRKKQA